MQNRAWSSDQKKVVKTFEKTFKVEFLFREMENFRSFVVTGKLGVQWFLFAQWNTRYYAPYWHYLFMKMMQNYSENSFPTQATS